MPLNILTEENKGIEGIRDIPAIRKNNAEVAKESYCPTFFKRILSEPKKVILNSKKNIPIYNRNNE